MLFDLLMLKCSIYSIWGYWWECSYGTEYFHTDLFWCTILRLLLIYIIWCKLIILKGRFKQTFNKLIRLVIKKLKQFGFFFFFLVNKNECWDICKIMMVQKVNKSNDTNWTEIIINHSHLITRQHTN